MPWIGLQFVIVAFPDILSYFFMRLILDCFLTFQFKHVFLIFIETVHVILTTHNLCFLLKNKKAHF